MSRLQGQSYVYSKLFWGDPIVIDHIDYWLYITTDQPIAAKSTPMNVPDLPREPYGWLRQVWALLHAFIQLGVQLVT